ncbi:hypothetical protein GCM10020221_24500 [Streptomyces thioluteus]|uniref:Regulatory protein n=1 Tax=Streptomyces thioluteus TaxID=66431 RepID=A0ABP6JBM2_STRTU
MLARRGFLGTSLALSRRSRPLIEPMQRWLVPTPSVTGGPVADALGARRARLSKPELDLLESTTRMFRAWDAQCGGGLRRKAVVGQLHEVTDLLQEPQPDETSKRLFKVAAELAELAGWMSYDIGLHPTAQKYFVLALHAAKEAGDRPLGSYILSSMSRQMIHLGRPEDALELIHLGQYGSRETATPRTQAMLYAMEGRAYASMGQPAKCKRAVGMAEDCFSDCTARDGDPDWISFFSEAELNAENAHSFRDLAYVAGRSPTYASLSRPKMERAVTLFEEDGEHQRSYALNLIGLATVDLMEREPEESTAHLGKALRIAKQVRSERVNNRPPQDRRHRPARLRRRHRGARPDRATRPPPAGNRGRPRGVTRRAPPGPPTPAAATLPYGPDSASHTPVTPGGRRGRSPCFPTEGGPGRTGRRASAVHRAVTRRPPSSPARNSGLSWPKPCCVSLVATPARHGPLAHGGMGPTREETRS